jgi:hypothetical protein
MIPDTFEAFFLATAGAGGAFIGLLFVAISIGPQRTFGDSAALGALRQFLAEAALVTLVNGFVVSCIALIPGINVGWAALAGGVWGTVTAAYLAWRIAHVHRHDPKGHAVWLHQLRVVSVSLLATVVYAIETLVAIRLILQPEAESAVRALGLVIIGLYVLAMLRAWILLGDPQHGWSSWLNPLEDRLDDHLTGGVENAAIDAATQRPAVPTAPRAGIDPLRGVGEYSRAGRVTRRRRQHR